METFTEKTIKMASNSLNISLKKKRHFKLEPVKPMSITEINSVLDGIKKINRNFEFVISWD